MPVSRARAALLLALLALMPACGRTTAAGGPPVVRGLAGGREHTCAVISNGNVICWGNQVMVGGGTPPDPDVDQNSPPVAVSLPLGTYVTEVTSGTQGGGFSTCALTDEGTAWCWGWGSDGQLGDGLGEYSFYPVPVTMPEDVRFTSIDAGAMHMCALTGDGAAWCWGNNSDGLLGDGTTEMRFEPSPVTMPDEVSFAAIAAASNHTCALSTEGVAWCWGWGESGLLGDGTRNSRTTPSAVEMPSGIRFTSIASGYFHTCALSTEGDAWCWGDNGVGELGDGTMSETLRPVAVVMPSGRSFTSIAVGDGTTCAVADDASIWCWGGNDSGVLGDGTRDSHMSPVQVEAPVGLTFGAIALGSQHACAVTTGATEAWCWGSNDHGQLGDGTTTRRKVPVQVAGGPSAWALSPSPPPSPSPRLQPVDIEPYPASAFRSAPPLWGLSLDETEEVIGALWFGSSEDSPWNIPEPCWDQRNGWFGPEKCLYAVLASEGVSTDALSLLDTHDVMVFDIVGEGPLWTAKGYSLANYGTNYHGDGSMIFGPSGIIAASVAFRGSSAALDAALASDLDERVQAAEDAAWGPGYGFYLGDPEDIVIPIVAPTRTATGWEVPFLARAGSGFHCCQYQFLARFVLEFDANGVQTGVRFTDWCYDGRETFSDASGGPPAEALQRIADIGATLPTC